jgi:hypothetical protein
MTPDTDLATIGEHVGKVVRVGGLVVEVDAGGFELDDGTAVARVVLRDGFAALLDHVRPGEAVAATGRIELVDGAFVVVIDDEDGALVRIGDLGQALPFGPTPVPERSPAAAPAPLEAGSLGPEPGPAGLAAVLLLSATSLLLTVSRRLLARRRARRALVARLSELGDTPVGA